MSDSMEKIRSQWAKEKAAGLWDEAYLEQERTARRAWIKEQRREREQEERKQFKNAQRLES